MRKKRKILWVEDEASLREVMCELLRDEGHDCIGASDGIEAKRQLEKESYDLLITDFNMPEMNGAQLVMWCRSSDLHMPVIFVSAAPDREPMEALVLNDCCTAFINKPFSIETLIKEVDEAFKRNHEFYCQGAKTLSHEDSDFENCFPGQHVL